MFAVSHHPSNATCLVVRFTKLFNSHFVVCRSLGDAIFPSEIHLGCQTPNVCKGCLDPWGDAIFPSEIHLGCQIPNVCKGCLDPRGDAIYMYCHH